MDPQKFHKGGRHFHMLLLLQTLATREGKSSDPLIERAERMGRIARRRAACALFTRGDRELTRYFYDHEAQLPDQIIHRGLLGKR